jgi:hypothetical protein
MTNVFLSRTNHAGSPWLSRSVVSGSARHSRRRAGSVSLGTSSAMPGSSQSAVPACTAGVALCAKPSGLADRPDTARPWPSSVLAAPESRPRRCRRARPRWPAVPSPAGPGGLVARPLSPCAASIGRLCLRRRGPGGFVARPLSPCAASIGRLCLRRRVRVGLWPGRSCCARLDEPILLLRRPGRVGSGPAAPSLCAALMAVLLSRQVWVGWRPAGVAVRGIDGGRSSSPARPRGLRQRPPRGRAR